MVVYTRAKEVLTAVSCLLAMLQASGAWSKAARSQRTSAMGISVVYTSKTPRLLYNLAARALSVCFVFVSSS